MKFAFVALALVVVGCAAEEPDETGTDEQDLEMACPRGVTEGGPCSCKTIAAVCRTTYGETYAEDCRVYRGFAKVCHD